MHLLQLLITTVALLLIALTMFLRAHELKDKGLIWNVRRVGLVLSAVSALGVTAYLWIGRDPSVMWTTFSIGIFMVLFTTPNGIPWHKWVWKGIHEDELPEPTLRSDRVKAIDRYREENP